jgi:aminoglycoside 3-N-acetyltransferase
MAHVSMSSLGWVVGGTETVTRALLEVLRPNGTLCAVLSWEDIPLHIDEWPNRWRRAYESELPGFDRETSEANQSYGRFAERLRTWPGAVKSGHPDQRVAAVGPQASWLVDPHPLDDSFGPGTPFERMVEIRGKMLLLGAPMKSLTLLHHAEAMAAVPSKRRWTYRLPFATDDRCEWKTLNAIDVEHGCFRTLTWFRQERIR